MAKISQYPDGGAPQNSDEFIVARSGQNKKLTWTNIKAALTTYFDGLYVALTGNQTVAGVKTFSSFPITPSSAPTTDYQVANKKYVDEDDGWIPISDTWTRTGNFTFTVGSDVTSSENYRPGTKVKVTDGSGTVYGVIESRTYSAPNTTITLIDNDDYTLDAGSLTNPYISIIEYPEGFPERFNYTPTITGSGSMTISNEDISWAQWWSQGQHVFVDVFTEFDLGGTAGTSVFLSAPSAIYDASPASSDSPAAVAGVRNASSGSIIVGTGAINPTLNAFGCRLYDSSNWSLGTNRRAVIYAHYRIDP